MRPDFARFNGKYTVKYAGDAPGVQATAGRQICSQSCCKRWTYAIANTFHVHGTFKLPFCAPAVFPAQPRFYIRRERTGIRLVSVVPSVRAYPSCWKLHLRWGSCRCGQWDFMMAPQDSWWLATYQYRNKRLQCQVFRQKWAGHLPGWKACSFHKSFSPDCRFRYFICLFAGQNNSSDKGWLDQRFRRRCLL